MARPVPLPPVGPHGDRPWCGTGTRTYQVAQIGAPTRLHVLVDDDPRCSVGVWGHTPPTPIS
ncbi:hypothetical protein [Kineococcus glutinatus]|uniref:Uncharacterized protein n=1 Tax=Kineococcus glutinatus TaxID=1070872 RepID=A0ABP9H715_9ACTN